MQSSPPVRAWDRTRRDSQTDSEYSLDLNALGLNAEDDTETRIPEQTIEKIHSEDIEGPSDFTQNMDMWMRGGTGGQGSASSRKRGTFNATTTVHTIQERHEEETRRVLRSNGLLDVPHKHGQEPEDERTESHYTPDTLPPKISVMDETQQDFSSEWQTDGEGSPPQPPHHKSLLQPTVEEYYSELSPARQHSQFLARGRSYQATSHTERHVSKGEQSTPGRASSPTLSPVRSPTLQRNSTHGTIEREMDHESRMALESQFKQLDVKCQQLEHLNAALGQALDDERRLRRQEKQSHESHSAEAARREQDLIDMKELAHRHNEDFRKEFGQLKEQQQKMAEARSHAEHDDDVREAELQRLRKEVELQKTEHDMQVRTLEQELESIRRNRDDAEQNARALRAELEQDRDEDEVEIVRLRTELRQAHEDEAAISALEQELLQVKSENERLKVKNSEFADQLQTVKEQLTTSERDHDAECSQSATERSRAIALASDLQRQLQGLRQQLSDEQAAHQTELQRLRATQQTSSATTTQEIAVIRSELEANRSELKAKRSELEAKQSALNTAVLERDEAHDARDRLADDTRDLAAKLADLECVNAALDARVADALRKREQYWREKLDESNRERELMAKALLHQWGREEVGVDDPQRYAYKYLRRGGGGQGKENRSPDRSKAKPRMSS